MKWMHMLAKSALAASLFLSLSTAQAEDKTDCAIKYTRTACPGKEADSYSKCDGKKSCTKYVPASSVEECKEAAVKACANDRLDVTKEKVINATYKGKPVKSDSGKPDFCADYAKRAEEFNQCSKK